MWAVRPARHNCSGRARSPFVLSISNSWVVDAPGEAGVVEEPPERRPALPVAVSEVNKTGERAPTIYPPSCFRPTLPRLGDGGEGI